MGHSRCTPAQLCCVRPGYVVGGVIDVTGFAMGINQHIYIEDVAA